VNRQLIAETSLRKVWAVYDDEGKRIGTDEQQLVFDPLNGWQVVATLNAVLGIWTLADAANVAGVTPEHLIAEAQAWAVAATQ